MKENVILALVIIFMAMWVYTEVDEYSERVNFMEHVEADLEDLKEFRSVGTRFTQEDGIELEERIKELEQQKLEKEE